MPSEERLDRVRKAALRRQRGMVILEDIHDLHNAAAVLRSCEAFGFQRVAFVFEHQEPFDPRCRESRVTSTSGSVWLDFEAFRSTREAITAVRARGYTVVATVIDDGAESIFKARLDEPRIAVLLGNEKRGLTDLAIEMADRRLTIPTTGMVQSLNLSVTASIFLYEITRQRQAEPERYLLSEAERARLGGRFEQLRKK